MLSEIIVSKMSDISYGQYGRCGQNTVLMLITIVILTIIMLIYNGMTSNNKLKDIEHYDQAIDDVSEVVCGTRCTEGLDCAGFAYKPIEKTCFLSKTGILGKPLNSIYSDRYSKLDRRCNKINRITDNQRIDGITLTQNSIYLCSDGEANTTTEFQYANLGASALEKVRVSPFEKVDIDSTTPVSVSYPTHYIDWPTKATSVSEFPTPLFETPANRENRLNSGSTSGTVTSNNKSDKRSAFIESDKEFLGQYLLAHQCVANVPFYDCLKFCENDQNCAGTEWNKSLVKSAGDGEFNYLYEDVCCPKAVVKQIIPRRRQFDRGRFYVKKKIEDIPDRDRIVVTKSDLYKTSIPINKRFALSTIDVATVERGFIDNKPLNIELPGIPEYH